jgi:hypothetical protein
MLDRPAPRKMWAGRLDAEWYARPPGWVLGQKVEEDWTARYQQLSRPDLA